MNNLVWVVALGVLSSTGKVINFDTGPLGKTPPEWTVSMTNHGRPPQWEIRKDGSAPTQPYVLAQLAADPIGDRFPMAILTGVNLLDGDVSVRIKPVSGHDVQAGGLVWRYRDENNYYLARASALDDNVAVFKVENGRRTAILPGVKHEIPTNAWSIMRVSVRGNRFQVFMDHRRVLQGYDNTFMGAGGVGLWTVGDSVTYFDDFRVSPR